MSKAKIIMILFSLVIFTKKKKIAFILRYQPRLINFCRLMVFGFPSESLLFMVGTGVKPTSWFPHAHSECKKKSTDTHSHAYIFVKPWVMLIKKSKMFVYLSLLFLREKGCIYMNLIYCRCKSGNSTWGWRVIWS